MRTDSRRQPKLRDQFRNAIRVRHYSVRTEKTYWSWIRYFIRFHRMRHPSEMAAPQVSAFLTWLATEGNSCVPRIDCIRRHPEWTIHACSEFPLP